MGSETMSAAELMPPEPRLRAPIYVLLFGVVLPILTLVVELTTRFCASVLFDPLPTLGHVLFFAMIPLASIAALWLRPAHHRRWARLAAVLTGIALVVVTAYAILFIPVTPLSVIAIFLMGVGLCGLCPLLAFVAIAFGTGYTRALARQRHWLWLGVAAGLLALTLIEAPRTLTDYALHQATAYESTSDIAKERAWGMRLLRLAGNRDVMLRACYGDARATSLFTGVFSPDPVSPDDARTVFYRLNGVAFNTVPAPRHMNRDGLFRGRGDVDQGGIAVGGIAPDLALASSRLDGSLDADALLGYMEWTLVFHNGNPRNQEARAQIALPPGAVVSRATLWVNGQPREAAFAARGHARAAYEEVAVVQQRDPLLITTCGPDRVLLQCFPVPPDGDMRVRVGITLPLTPEGKDSALVALPQFVERNFALASDRPHAVWMEATRPMSARKGLRAEQTGDGFALRGALMDAALQTPLRVQRDPAVTTSWTPDPARPGMVIRQRWTAQPATPPSRLVVVLDGARGMAADARLLEQLGALRKVPGAVILAGETPYTLLPLQTAGFGKTLTECLRAARFTGGPDNVPALERAWDLAAETPGGAILWLHGPQPVASDLDPLRQRWERRPQGPRLYALQVRPGPNEVLAALDDIPAVQRVPVVRTAADALADQLTQWTDNTPRPLLAERVRVPRAQATGKQTSTHLVRLWARDGAQALYRQQTPRATEQAIALAARYHLVTPVTGAVVLETKEQYADHDLTPAGENVPIVPEPEEWALLALALSLPAILWWRKRRVAMSR